MNDFCIKSRTVTDNENHSNKKQKKQTKKAIYCWLEYC